MYWGITSPWSSAARYAALYQYDAAGRAIWTGVSPVDIGWLLSGTETDRRNRARDESHSGHRPAPVCAARQPGRARDARGSARASEGPLRGRGTAPLSA